MPVNKVYSVLGLILACTTLSVPSVWAAGTTLQDAIVDYNHNQYASGLKKFLALEKTPGNVMAHYYAALCEQNLIKQQRQNQNMSGFWSMVMRF